MKKVTYLLFAFLVIVFFSCRKTDKESPTLLMVSPNDSLIFDAGAVLPFSASFFDNEELSQFKIDIHENFEGHVHDKYIAKIWNKIIIGNLSGIEKTEMFDIAIPDSAAAGWYHFLLTTVDASGNQSEIGVRSIYIRNNSDTVLPEITVSGPLENDQISLGTSLTLNANISDNQHIYIIQTRVKRPNSASSLFQSNDTLVNPLTQFNLLKEIPTNGAAWTTGNYILTVNVYDSYFNKQTKIVNVQLN